MRKPTLNKESIKELESLIPSFTRLNNLWKVPKSPEIREKDKKFETWLIWADTHVPYHNSAVIRVLLKLAEDIKFDGMVVDGDFMDLDCISHWNKGKALKTEGKRLLSDYAEGNLILDEFDKRLPKDSKKVFIYGNHERFYNDFIEEYPVLQGIGDPTGGLKLVERGYKILDKQNEIFKLGKLSICHGMYTGDNAVKRHVQSFMTNVLFAHVHSQAEFCSPSPAKEISTYGASIGCTCDHNPDYMKGACHKWTHGFAIVYLYDRGFFDVDLKRIINGKVIFNNKLYNGNR